MQHIVINFNINLIFLTKYLHDTHITWELHSARYNPSTRTGAHARAQYLPQYTLYYSCVAIKSNTLAILKISVSLVLDNSANFAMITCSSETFVSKQKKYIVQYTIAALRKSMFDFNDVNFLAICSAFRTSLRM